MKGWLIYIQHNKQQKAKKKKGGGEGVGRSRKKSKQWHKKGNNGPMPICSACYKHMQVFLLAYRLVHFQKETLSTSKKEGYFLDLKLFDNPYDIQILNLNSIVNSDMQDKEHSTPLQWRPITNFCSHNSPTLI